MTPLITSEIIFKNTLPAQLYSVYMNSARHSAAIGSKVSIQKKKNSAFYSWDGYISGKTLQLITNRLIVQSWRSTDFHESDPDSLLILLFEQKGRDALLIMVHALVPDHIYSQIKKGWNEYYWKPWKKYLSQR